MEIKLIVDEVDFQILKDHLKIEEGFSSIPYKDSLGILTIGYGHKIISNIPIPFLCDGGISKKFADILLYKDLKSAEMDLLHNCPVYVNLDIMRKYVLLDLCFNLGITGLLRFHKMCAALYTKNYKEAAYELKNSLAAEQEYSRIEYLSYMLEFGVMPK